MAVNCTCSTQIPIHKYGSFLKYPNKKLMCKRTSDPLRKTSVLRITVTAASTRNKVYEDQSQGIVCYQDEHGEITCEGYDEGPCFQRISKPAYHPRDCAGFRDAQFTNLLLPRGWLQIVKGDEELSDAVEGVSLQQEDLNCNGFNSFC